MTIELSKPYVVSAFRRTLPVRLKPDTTYGTKFTKRNGLVMSQRWIG